MAYNDLVADCLQNEPAFCTAECPFNLDVRDFVGKLQQGRFNIAYKTYRQVVGFPGIVIALCGEPCNRVCILKDKGGSVSLKLLEKASLEYARDTAPDQYNMPAKDKRIAIIGAGISGLACALRLVAKKYQITVFEKSGNIGGHLHELLPPEIFMDDIRRQFMHEKYILNPDTEITSLDGLDFDAVYVATGKAGNDFGLSPSADGTFASTKDGVFMGGSLIGSDTMHAIADGLNASYAIETWLKIGRMNNPVTAGGTRLMPEAVRPGDSPVVLPANSISYAKAEAVEEAKRCLRCSCDACVRYSPLMGYFQKFPKRITEEVQVTLTPSSLDGNATLATRLISTCDHCGLCKEVCPKSIDTGEFLLKSHKAMWEKGAMPWAFHEFFLRDMDFSNTEAALCKPPPGKAAVSHVFFPGCQLGASDPEYVTRSYRFLLTHFPGTALMLNCCGAPAEWAGDEPLHAKVIEKIRKDWAGSGKPSFIFACATCKLMFQKYLPEIKGQFLYTTMAEKGLQAANDFSETTASVFDPCASRHEAEVQQSIRELALQSGFTLKPLPLEGKLAGCCSYGGQTAITHPPLAAHSVKQKISQNDYPYITYCSNCRDIFAAAGKPSWHILDILFGLGSEIRPQPGISERRNNRMKLKQQLLNEFWNELQTMEKHTDRLLVSAELKEKLNKEWMLEQDILTVIDTCEQSGKKLSDRDAGTFSGHMAVGNMTYWVEYRPMNNGQYELVNAYCHRMKIEEMKNG